MEAIAPTDRFFLRDLQFAVELLGDLSVAVARLQRDPLWKLLLGVLSCHVTPQTERQRDREREKERPDSIAFE
jgi:hypothetical protein